MYVDPFRGIMFPVGISVTVMRIKLISDVLVRHAKKYMSKIKSFLNYIFQYKISNLINLLLIYRYYVNFVEIE